MSRIQTYLFSTLAKRGIVYHAEARVAVQLASAFKDVDSRFRLKVLEKYRLIKTKKVGGHEGV